MNPDDASLYLGMWLGLTTSHRQTWLFSFHVSLNRPPDRTWRRPPGRPRNEWLDQLRNDSTRRPIGELWRRAVDRGHGGAMQRRVDPRRLRDNDDDVCLCVFRTDVCDRVTVSQMDRCTFARHVQCRLLSRVR